LNKIYETDWNIENCDALIKGLDFYEDNLFRKEKFDFVVGNPPYIAYNQCCKQKNDLFELIKQGKIKLNNIYGVNLHSVPNFPKRYRPNPNLYTFFIALGLALLKNNGKLSFIIPQNMLTAGDLDVIRYHLAKNTTVEKIITFDGNLFVGRGLKQNKPIATSSLIFVVKKQIPPSKHKIKVINYKAYSEKQGVNFEKYLKSKKKSSKEIFQSELLDKFSNWNFIKKDRKFINFVSKYNKNQDIAIYYDHKIAEKAFNAHFYFDGGYNIDEKQILRENSVYIYPKINNLYYSIKEVNGFWTNERESQCNYLLKQVA